MVIDPMNERLFGMPEMCSCLRTTRNGVHALMKLPGFPVPLRFDPTNPKSRLRFRATEVLAWITAQQRLTAMGKERATQLGNQATT